MVRLTLSSLMKLIAFAAVACACLAPFLFVLPPGIEGPLTLAFVALTTIPLSWACLSFVLVRGGSFRDLLIFGLLLCASAIVFITSLCWAYFFAKSLGLVDAIARLIDPAYLHTTLLLLGLITFFGAAIGYLASRLIVRLRTPTKTAPSAALQSTRVFPESQFVE